MEVVNALGRRKSAVARVFVSEGTGKITINKRDLAQYFPSTILQYVVKQPLNKLEAAEKYDIKVNLYGGGFTGQSQALRLAIARALLHDAPLVLLDEPTEGLDATTEGQILELLAEMMCEKTVLMVTHRLRGLSRFQQIIVMDNGQIIEQGTHAELLARQGRYYQFKQGL